MDPKRHILIVTRDAWRERAIPVWLCTAGYHVSLVNTFADAKARLEERPAALVTDIKLGAYNGLHLAIRAQSAGIPVIAMGTDDRALEREAEALHARWLGAAPTREAILAAVEDVVAAAPGHEKAASSFDQECSFPWVVFTPAAAITHDGKPVLH
jgi:DNA-binding response OmpR family regulator